MYGKSPFSMGKPFPGHGGQNPSNGPTPNANAYEHANENAAFMRPQFPGGMGQPSMGQAVTGQGGMAGRAITDLPPHLQEILNQRWGMFGGGAPMPSTFGDYRTAMHDWRQALPQGSPRGWGQMGWRGGR